MAIEPEDLKIQAKQGANITDADREELHKNLKALIEQMFQLGVNNIRVEAKNVGKSGARVELLPLNE
jgi:phosphosulfolactate synthase (CoM biosynthesis protein A)